MSMAVVVPHGKPTSMVPGKFNHARLTTASVRKGQAATNMRNTSCLKRHFVILAKQSASDMDSDEKSNSRSFATKDTVVSAASSTALSLCASAVVLRLAVSITNLPNIVPSSSATFAFLPSSDNVLANMSAGLGVAVSVFFARKMFNILFLELKESSDNANRMVLTDLEIQDIFLISVFSGMSEEIFFRWALMPAISADWRGVCISAAVFGSLHIGDGRTPAFAVWATGVGTVYGFLALFAHDASTAALAHTTCNFLSGTDWKRNESSFLTSNTSTLDSSSSSSSSSSDSLPSIKSEETQKGEG